MSKRNTAKSSSKEDVTIYYNEYPETNKMGFFNGHGGSTVGSDVDAIIREILREELKPESSESEIEETETELS